MRKLIAAMGIIVVSFAVAPGRAEEPAECAVMARTFSIPDSNLPDVTVKDATVSLIGEPGAKSIGFSFRASVDPKADPTGEEKLLLYLYVACDEKGPAETTGINVGIVPVVALKRDMKESTLITSTEANALVPLRNIQCVKLELG